MNDPKDAFQHIMFMGFVNSVIAITKLKYYL